MRYERNEWVKKAIQEADLEKLRAFEKRLKGITLAEALDQKSIRIFATLCMEDEEKIEREFPGIVKRVSFEFALMGRNIWLLEKNKDVYFKADWEKTVKDILFLPDNSSIRWSDQMYEDGYVEKLYVILKWIKDNIGKIPPIDGISELCSKLEMVDRIHMNHICKMESQEVKKKTAKAVSAIRELLEDKKLVIDAEENYKENGLETFDYSLYDSISILFSIEEPKKNIRILLSMLKGNVDDNQIIHVDIHKYIDDKKLLKELEFEDGLQKKICRLYGKDGKLNELYEMIEKELISTGAYTEIISAYYKEEKKLDSIIEEKEEVG